MIVALFLLGTLFAQKALSNEDCAGAADCTSCLSHKGCIWSLNSMTCIYSAETSSLYDRHITEEGQCLSVMRNAFAYNDTQAREVVFPLSALPYTSNAKECLKNAGFHHHIKIIEEREVLCAGHYHCKGFLIADDDGIYLTFGGPEFFNELLLKDRSQFATMEAFDRKKTELGKVGAFFLDVYKEIWSARMTDALAKEAKRRRSKPIWIVGHGTGAGIAAIASMYLVHKMDISADRIRFVTLGQPMVGDSTFSQSHSEKFPYSYRIVVKSDEVPHLPRVEGYSQLNYEVAYYDKDGTSNQYSVCTSFMDCSKETNITPYNNLFYFGESIYNYAARVCSKY